MLNGLLQYGFWVCLTAIAYTYFGYPVLLFIAYGVEQLRRDMGYLRNRADRRTRNEETPAEALPSVSIIVPAYNERPHLFRKIESLRGLDYPREKLQIVFVSDGSTDGTNEYLLDAGEGTFEPLILRERKGKANALNQGVRAARHEVLIFCDASTLLPADAVSRLVRHFRDPEVGMACAALRYFGTAEFEQTEGVYWSLETILRIMEDRLGAILTPSGALYALRKSCYMPLPTDALIDDFIVAANVRRKGLAVMYDHEVVALDVAGPSVHSEFIRRVRLATGSYRALWYLLRTPMPGFAFIAFFSHKLLRWALPFLLIGVFAFDAALAAQPFYRAVLMAQLLFYGWAWLGYCMRRHAKRWRYLLLAYFVVSMNAAFLVGFVRALRGGNRGTWQRVN
ncbi:MAG: glycosyltransferase family 2 protein [Acidobacteria bacterium]|nr:glycosyltransferase family 2 protein [Acidobacteriota bacterium]